MFCPNCGKEQVGNPKFCPSCGTKLVQESVIQSDIEPEIKPSVEPRVNQGIQPKSRSAALKWGAGILFVLTVICLINMIDAILLSLRGFVVPFGLGYFITFCLVLAAAIHAVRRKHWGYVLGATIWILVIDIIWTFILFGGEELGFILPGDIAFLIFVLLLEITCLILIARTKAEFSGREKAK